jgi:hypothetical protein
MILSILSDIRTGVRHIKIGNYQVELFRTSESNLFRGIKFSFFKNYSIILLAGLFIIL